MPVYNVSYDLSKPDQDYEELYDAINAMGSAYHALESTWLLDTSETSAGTIRKELQDVMDDDDSILVTQLPETGGGRWSYGGISGELGDWLREHLT